MEEKKLTGFPSIDKPWLKYYSEEAINAPLPECTVYEYLWERNNDHFDDIALIYFNRSISYRSLFLHIDSAEQALLYLGVSTGDIVSIALPSMPETVYLFYALSKIGAVANMIDPRSDADMLRHYLQEAESKVFIYLDRCESVVDAVLPSVGVKTAVSVSPAQSLPIARYLKHTIKSKNSISWNTFIRSGKAHPQNSVIADVVSTAVLMTHTSGTTGMPKGVLLSNRNINAVAHQYEVKIDHRRGQRYLCVIPPFIAFGVCVAIHMPVTLGVASVLIPQFVAADFMRLLRRYRPEHLVCTPSNYEALLACKSNTDLSFLLSPGVGGDSMEAGYERAVNQYLSNHGCKSGVLKGYGMTEVSSTSCLCWPDCNGIGSVGIPPVNMMISVVEIGTTDELLYGELGEICFSGPNIMLGYFKNPEATAAALKRHGDGQVWMHSGDVGYMTEDGMVYVVDRIKRAVYIDGQRVFPSTVERILLKCGSVDKCTVVGNKTGKLISHVVIQGKQSEDEIRGILAALCKAELPGYAQPSEYVFRDSLPLTTVGKVDYRALEQEAER